MNYRQQKMKDIVSDCETKIIERLVNRLLENLYSPAKGEKADEGLTFVGDKKKLEKYGLDTEDINWGDLSVEKVVKIRNKDKFLVKIQEAAPCCPNLCQYIERYMFEWGWDVKVKTDW